MRFRKYLEYILVFAAIVFVPFTVAGLPILLIMYHPEIARISFELGLVWLVGVAICWFVIIMLEGFRK